MQSLTTFPSTVIPSRNIIRRDCLKESIRSNSYLIDRVTEKTSDFYVEDFNSSLINLRNGYPGFKSDAFHGEILSFSQKAECAYCRQHGSELHGEVCCGSGRRGKHETSRVPGTLIISGIVFDVRRLLEFEIVCRTFELRSSSSWPSTSLQ